LPKLATATASDLLLGLLLDALLDLFLFRDVLRALFLLLDRDLPYFEDFSRKVLVFLLGPSLF